MPTLAIYHVSCTSYWESVSGLESMAHLARGRVGSGGCLPGWGPREAQPTPHEGATGILCLLHVIIHSVAFLLSALSSAHHHFCQSSLSFELTLALGK